MLEPIEDEKMRQAIINTALHLCIKEGLTQLKMINIAHQMGIAPTEHIYLYFDDKKAMIKSLLQEHLEKLKEHKDSIKINKTIDQLLNSLKSSPKIDEEESYFLPIFSEAFLPYLSSDAIVKEYRYFFNDLEDSFVQELEKRIDAKKLNPNTNTSALAKILIAMLDGAVLHKGIFTAKKQGQLTLVKKALQRLKTELWKNKPSKLVA